VKNYCIGTLVLALFVGACTKTDDASSAIQSINPEAVLQKHDEITQSSVISEFMAKVSAENYADALQLIHPKLAKAWTSERFAEDWTGIRSRLSEQWKPEATGSFSGMSQQGQYEQASYRLSSDWSSLASVDLTSMLVEETDRIVQIRLRAPYDNGPPQEVVKLGDEFLNSLSGGDVPSAHNLIAAANRAQIPVALLEQLRPIVGSTASDGEKNYYRLSINTVWYDAVSFTPSNEPATFIELILESSEGTTQIVSLSGKTRQ
jgi:hypothetical protein